MKKLTTILAIIAFTATFAQESPVEYMEDLSSYYKELQQKMWDYTSSMAHEKKAKKVDEKRQELITTVKKSIKNVEAKGDYKGDNEFKNSILGFLETYKNVLENDYAKIIDIEEIAEQSYDAMEALLNTKKAINNKVNEASDLMSEAQKKFCAANNIKLVEDESDLSKKMKKANEVNSYYNSIYLVFFKSNIQDALLMDAIAASDVLAIEQNKNTLATISEEGIKKIKEMEAYEGDNSVKEIALEVLAFYNDEATNRIDKLSKMYTVQEKFNRIKAAFDKLKPKERTKEEVDKYNAAVNELNESVNTFNAENKSITEEKNKLIEKYNKTVHKFTSKHTPK